MAGFARRIGLLGGATAGGQIAAALNLVIIARLLPQAEVGAYAIFLSYAMILLPVSLLSYEVLLPNVADDEVPVLLHGMFPLAAGVSALTATGFSVFGYPHAGVLATLLLSMAVLRLVEFSGIRTQRVRLIALARVLPHLGVMLLLGVLALSPSPSVEALLWLQIAAFAVPAAALAWAALAPDLLTRPDWPRTARLLVARWRNPLLFAPSEIASTVAWNLPVVLVAGNFGAAMAAQYGVMLRYAMAPVGLVNSVVGNVYHSDLAQGVRSGDDRLHERFRFMRKRMLLIGLAAGAATGIFLPPLLRLLLGPGWEMAGDLAMLMSPLVAVAVWISPFGVSFYVFERSWELLLLNLAYVAIAISAFTLATGSLKLATGLFVLLAIARFLIMLIRVERMVRPRAVA